MDALPDRSRASPVRTPRRRTLAGGLLLAACAGWHGSARALDAAVGTADRQAFALAVRALARHARFPLTTLAAGSDPIRNLKRYILDHDPHGDYLTPAELRQYRRAGRPDHAGIGVQLERDAAGVLRVLPDPDGPAARAGVPGGARLLAIDGHAVQDLALPSVAALAAGMAGSVLRLQLAAPDGSRLELAVPRARANGPSVLLQHLLGRPVIRITAFTPDTRETLEYLLHGIPAGQPCILDLRGCAGGDLHAAIDCAMLFLARGTLLGSLQRGRQLQAWRCTRRAAPFGGALVLWQDEATASAAEVLIAALVDNGRAITVGRRSFGKGSVQELIALPDGAALILSTAEVRSPVGRAIDGQGLEAQRSVAARGDDPAPWLARSDEGRPP